MYLQNKYTRWYYSIIQRAQTRTISNYTEKHHIIPKSLGGSNNKDNLVALTAREHFVCHLLLTRITTGEARKKMVFAVFYLTGKGKSNRNNKAKNSRLYSKLKEDLCKIVSQQHKGSKRPKRSEEYRLKQTQSKLGQHNGNFKGVYITPWGNFESSRLAAKNCPNSITANYIIRLCRNNNAIPISYLSVCRSKGYLDSTFVGLTPKQLGFDFSVNICNIQRVQ